MQGDAFWAFIDGVKVLITGGSGFLGRHLIQALKRNGIEDIRIFCRHVCEDLAQNGVEVHYGDLTDFEAISNAVKACEVVFHVAAKAGVWGSYKNYYRANVEGTLNVLKACQHWGVKKLVYTSTPSVVFNGQSLSNVTESTPYGKHWLCAYAKTKRIAEEAVLRANGENGLCTVALRPHLIWGPGDQHLIPNLLKLVRKGLLFKVGDGNNWVDVSYVENVADAHVMAMNALGNGKIDGKAYFISQDDPVRLWDWINELLGRLNLPRVQKRIPFRVAYAMGACFELVYKLLHISAQPPMTRFVATELSKDHYFSMAAAKMDLHYLPKISNEEGMQKLVTWIKSSAM